MTEDTPFAETASAAPSLPPGIPTLLPPGIEQVLGGRPIPMRVGRVAPAAAAPQPGPLPAGYSPTLTGASPLDLATQVAIADCRTTLSRAVAEMTKAESELPAIIARIEPAEDDAASIAHFDLSEVRRFLAHLTIALNELRS